MIIIIFPTCIAEDFIYYLIYLSSLTYIIPDTLQEVSRKPGWRQDVVILKATITDDRR